MNFKLQKTLVLSFLGDFYDNPKDFKSQLLENYSTNFIRNAWRFSKKITFHDYDWVHDLLNIFIDVIVYSAVWRTKISMKYFDAANTFLVGGMNFNRVYKEVSKDIPFIWVSEIVVWCSGEPVSSSIYSSSQISIRLVFSFRVLVSFSHRFATCPFLQFSGLVQSLRWAIFVRPQSEEIVEYWEQRVKCSE